MDAVTTAVYSLNNPFITTISAALDDRLVLAALLLALVLSEGLKLVEHVARPCASDIIAKLAACPTDYSLPSTHAVVGFVLAAAFIGRRSFWLFFPLGLFIAFTRMYLGVHTIFDVAAGLAVAFLSVAIVHFYLLNYLPELADDTPIKLNSSKQTTSNPSSTANSKKDNPRRTKNSKRD